VRDLGGKMCELIEEPGLKPVHRGLEGSEVLGMSKRGLVQIKEVSLMDFRNADPVGRFNYADHRPFRCDLYSISLVCLARDVIRCSTWAPLQARFDTHDDYHSRARTASTLAHTFDFDCIPVSAPQAPALLSSI
jgi:hypothetical protein